MNQAELTDAVEALDVEVSAFLDGLRQLRVAAGGPSFRSMARVAHYSHTALSGAISGGRLPSLDLALAFVRACGGDEDEWRRRWHRAQEHLIARAERAAPARRWPTSRWPVFVRPVLGWVVRRPRAAAACAAGMVVLGGLGVTGSAVLTSQPSAQADPAACNPLPAGEERIDRYVVLLRSVTGAICARPVGVTGLRITGQQELAGQQLSYYVQRNPDGYVQLQVDASATAGHGEWSAYWQENPPDNPAHPGCSWYQQKVVDAGAAVTWRTTGWLCPVPPSGSPDQGTATVFPACNPLPASNPEANQYVSWLRSTAQPVCAAIPVRGGRPVQKLSGQTTGTTVIGTQSAFYRVQRDADGYVELELIGPTTGADPQPAWSVYWQANPPDDLARPGCSWYRERVEVRGQPTWQVNGWLCAATS